MKLLLLLGLAVVASCERRRFDGCDVWQVTPKTEKQVRQLHNFFERHDDERDFEITFWEEPSAIGNAADVLACTKGAVELKHFLGYSGIEGKIIEHNIQDHLDELWARSDARRVYDPNDFNTLADINDRLLSRVGDCPAGFDCSLSVIGSSYEGRDINAFQITRAGSGRGGVYIDALTHCREWLAGATVMGMLDRLLDGYGSDPVATRLLDNNNFYIVPVVNPDGYIYTWGSNRLWRKSRSPNAGSTCVGTDLNRNYAFMHGPPGSSGNPCSDLYHGGTPASQSETRAIQDYAESLRGQLTLFLTFHTYGNYYLHPYGTEQNGACMRADNHDDLMRVGNAAGDAIREYSGVQWRIGPTCEVLYTASGSTCDWAHGVGLVNFSYTPELRGGSFTPPSSTIAPSTEENWRALDAMISAI